MYLSLSSTRVRPLASVVNCSLTDFSMFRALCHQLWEIVEDRFPDSRHSAVGSFIFLRFFCPAIVSPEAIDLAVPAESREVRRALLLITKVIQNLANNVKFKEPHMQILNAFLAENIKQVTRFLSDVAVSLDTSSISLHPD